MWVGIIPSVEGPVKNRKGGGRENLPLLPDWAEISVFFWPLNWDLYYWLFGFSGLHTWMLKLMPSVLLGLHMPTIALGTFILHDLVSQFHIIFLYLYLHLSISTPISASIISISNLYLYHYCSHLYLYYLSISIYTYISCFLLVLFLWRTLVIHVTFECPTTSGPVVCQHFRKWQGLYLTQKNQNPHAVSLTEFSGKLNRKIMQTWFINCKVLYKTKPLLQFFNLGFWVASKWNFSQRDKLELILHLKWRISLQCWCSVMFFHLWAFLLWIEISAFYCF